MRDQAKADHVSLAFTEGRFLDDPDTILEGSGKTRRHIKLHRVEDIAGSVHVGWINPRKLAPRRRYRLENSVDNPQGRR